MEKPILSCTNLCKSYFQGNDELLLLSNINLCVSRGERIAIVGASGSGKSTLLNLLGGLDLPTNGAVQINGKPLANLNDIQLSQLRNKELGFVYQFHHLLPEFDALENVAMPLMISGLGKSAAFEKASLMLKSVGLADRANHQPSALSGGERQRVAIARALINEPACVMMDEPTGNLDRKSSMSIELLMESLSQQLSTAFVVATHDELVAERMDKIYRLENTELVTVK